MPRFVPMYSIPGTMMMVIMHQWVNRMMAMLDPVGEKVQHRYEEPDVLDYWSLHSRWKASLPFLG